MSLSRRKFLAIIGGGTVFAASAGATTFVNTRTPTKALAPWDQAGQYDDHRLRALSYALLAPNPHNRQPWEVELVGDDGVTIWRDKARDLPVTDPFGRQLTIGMGCFIELMEMAAAREGFGVEKTLFPDGEDGPVAICRFVPDAVTPDPLFGHVFERRSHKEAFEDRQIEASKLAKLADFADVYAEGENRDALRQIAADAWMVEMRDEAAYLESVDLFRIGKREINASPDGIDLGGAFMETLYMTGLFNHEIARNVSDPNVVAVAEADRDTMLNVPAMVMLKTPANTRVDQLNAGRDWLRYNLAATSHGLATRPVSQALQEYEAVRPLHEAIHARFAPDGETVQMLGLLGYGTQTPRTPRWPLETRLRDGQA
ncbi:MAG: twin-arginine translocation pathway signal protein [Pseudomonadota bacterium]